jgi:undecaprenyl-diphosphatase
LKRKDKLMPMIERRAEPRGLLSTYSDPIYGALRASAAKADSLVGALGIFLVGGLIVAIIGTAVFVTLASNVRSGSTQAFDESVIRWLAAHHTNTLDTIMVEITALGTGIVVMMIVAVAALFLVLTKHKYSVILLFASAVGGIVLNGVLKLGFNRPRPSLFAPLVHAVGSSFPSGHAMNAAIVYTTLAYLAARLHKRGWARWFVMTAAFIVIALISFSRMYLGVHYPSDVLAGIIVGLAWAGFCMAMLEAIQNFAFRRDPLIQGNEKPAVSGTPQGPMGSSWHHSHPPTRPRSRRTPASTRRPGREPACRSHVRW